jgi:hypothetical protein
LRRDFKRFSHYRWGLHVSVLLFVPLIVFHLSMTLDRMSIFIFGLPFIPWLDPTMNMSVKEFIRTLGV